MISAFIRFDVKIMIIWLWGKILLLTEAILIVDDIFLVKFRFESYKIIFIHRDWNVSNHYLATLVLSGSYSQRWKSILPQ